MSRSFKTFFNWPKEEQATYIEKQTTKLLKRLPKLKKMLGKYNEVSSELYNLSPQEVQLIGETYSQAIRGGEISTPSSKKAYKKFISSLSYYNRNNIRQLATSTANQRLENWLDYIEEHGSIEDIEYAKLLISQMSDSQKIGFTTSKYFMDTDIWYPTFEQQTDEGIYSIQTLKLELYLETYDGIYTRNIYNNYVSNDGQQKLRPSVKGHRVSKKKDKY